MMHFLQATRLAPVAGRWSRRLGAALLLLLAGGGAVQAQVAGYAFSQVLGSYVPLVGGNLLGNGSTDDEQFIDPAVPMGTTRSMSGPGLPIGFTFQFSNVAYDRFGVNANGWISLGNSRDGLAAVQAKNLTSGGDHTPLSGADLAIRSIIAPFADLLNAAGGQLSYGLEGSAPARTLVVQWSNYKVTNSNTYAHFQIRLNEGSNTVVFSYGSCFSGVTYGLMRGIEVGIRGAAFGDFNVRSGDAWTTTTAGNTAIRNAISMWAGSVPPNGLAFVFTPPVCFGATSLFIMSTTAGGALLTYVPSTSATSTAFVVTPWLGTPSTVPATPPPMALTGLLPGGYYTVEGISTCAGGSTSTARPVSFFTTLTNDYCATATVLPVNATCIPHPGTLIGATDYVNGSCNPNTAPDVWYTVEVPASRAVLIRSRYLAGNPFVGTTLAVHDDCNNRTPLFCRDPTGVDNELKAWNQTPGAVLYVRVRGPRPTNDLGFMVCAMPAQSNDEPTEADDLSLAGTALATGNTLATTTRQNGYNHPAACAPNTAPKDVWYTFRTDPAGVGPQTVQVQVGGNAAGLVRVFSATTNAGPFNELACAAGTASNTPAPPLLLTGLTPNTIYYVSVAGYSTTDAPGPFTIGARNRTATATRAALAGQPVEVYPNPAHRSATLRLPALGSVGSAQVSLFNALGQVVRTQAVPTAATATEAALPLTGLPAGLYTVRVQAGAETAVLRLAVE